jgi:hypothetical protein
MPQMQGQTPASRSGTKTLNSGFGHACTRSLKHMVMEYFTHVSTGIYSPTRRSPDIGTSELRGSGRHCNEAMISCFCTVAVGQVYRLENVSVVTIVSHRRNTLEVESATLASPKMAQLVGHQHGKSNVRLGRVWREGTVHTFVEWTVSTVLESDMAHAYLEGSNEGMTPTDTQKNTVYYISKRLKPGASPEEFAVTLAKHFVATYTKVSKAKVSVCEAPWQRHTPCGHAHDHGYEMRGSGSRTAYAEHDDLGITIVHGGIKEWRLLKTTQSGYEGASEQISHCECCAHCRTSDIPEIISMNAPSLRALSTTLQICRRLARVWCNSFNCFKN